MATLPKAGTETIDRPAAVENVLASFRMEGLEPDSATTALLEEFSSGRLSIEELGSAIECHTNATSLSPADISSVGPAAHKRR
jgi:hypothetical protein